MWYIIRFLLLQSILYWRVKSTLDVTGGTIFTINTTSDLANETKENTDFRFIAVTTSTEENGETETVEDFADIGLLRGRKSLDHNATVADDQACVPPPQVERAYPTGSTDGAFLVGSVVAYACDFGYVAAGSKRSTACQLSSVTQKPEWTKMQLKCNPRSCGDPGYVLNGRVVGSLFTFPHNVTVQCDEGYERRGQRTSFCQANGEWSGTLPTCERVLCPVPTSPPHGISVFSSLDYGSVLRYECEKGFRLDKVEPRICTQKGRWSGHQPNCSEMHCDPPTSPQNGSVQILDPDLKVGSLILYSCDEGTILEGSARTTCSIDGHWIFPAPKCVVPCSVPRIPNGEMGKFVQKRWGSQFQKSRVGDTFGENEKQTIRCDPDYFVYGTKSEEADVLCTEGKWTTENLTCVSSLCTEDPPPTENGIVYAVSNKHGGTVTYLCNDLYKKAKYGNVTCRFSQWEGVTPLCEKADCILSELNDPGLVDSPRVYMNGYSYDPSCKSGYETSRVQNKLMCRNGTWTGYTPACQPASCRSNPPRIRNGRVIPECSTHGCNATYSCSPSFSLEGNSTVQCLYGQWEGDPPKCRSAKCNVPRIPDGEIGRQVTDFYDNKKYQKSRPGENMQSGTEYILRCNANYHVGGTRSNEIGFFCTNGEFSETLLCASSSCLDHPPPTKNGDVFRKNSEHGGTVVYLCHEKFEKKKYGNITCLFGLWEGVTPTCEGEGASSLTSAKEKEIPLLFDHRSVVQSTTAVPTHTKALEPKPECTCLYHTSDTYLEAYIGSEKLEPGSEISQGTRVRFNCQNFEYRKLVGQTETVCESCEKPLYSPSCREPSSGDTVVALGGDVHSRSGFLEIERGGSVRLTCYALQTSKYEYPTWMTPSSLNAKITYGNPPNGHMYTNLEITSLDERHAGEYTCGGQRLKSTILKVRVVEPNRRCPLFPEEANYSVSYVADRAHFFCKDTNQKLMGASSLQCYSDGRWSGQAPDCRDVECPDLLQSHNLTTHYTDGRRVGSTATFHCFAPLKLNGHASLKCLKNGSWSADKPSCVLPDCSVDTLYSHMKDAMYPVMEDVAGDTVPYGTNITLKCEDGQQLTHPAMAACGADGKWTIPNVRCISGCEPISKVPGSSLIVEPQQDFYRLGEQISLSCPPELELTSKVEVVMCFGGNWSEIDIPDCKPKDKPNNKRKNKPRNKPSP